MLLQSSLQFSKDAQVSKSTKDLILSLCTDSQTRIGYEGLTCHRFFTGTDWNNLQDSKWNKTWRKLWTPPQKAYLHVPFNWPNRPFSKMAAENSNKLKLKTYTSARKSTFTLVTLQSFSTSDIISAEKM